MFPQWGPLWCYVNQYFGYLISQFTGQQWVKLWEKLSDGSTIWCKEYTTHGAWYWKKMYVWSAMSKAAFTEAPSDTDEHTHISFWQWIVKSYIPILVYIMHSRPLTEHQFLTCEGRNMLQNLLQHTLIYVYKNIHVNKDPSKMAVFQIAAPCSLVEIYQHFRSPCCLHNQGHN
jgi:hypothetical protein